MKIFKLFFSVSLFLVIFHAEASQQQSQRDILHPHGLLWKIEKPGQRTSYLYGTMHVSDARVVSLPKEVEQAFVQSDYFVMEMVLNFKAVGHVTRASFFDDGTKLSQVMGYLDYKRLLSLLNKRIFLSENIMQHMKPWAVLMLLMTPLEQQIEISAALDMVLLRRATQRKMHVLGLETPEEQVAVFESMSIDEQVWMLNQSIENINSSDVQMERMLEMYLARDLQGLVHSQQLMMDQSSDIDDRFMLELLDKRNLRMATRMQPALSAGRAFIAIGALHLPGEAGVLHLLEQQGYRVSPIY